jgi:hypothetical protein
MNGRGRMARAFDLLGTTETKGTLSEVEGGWEWDVPTLSSAAKTAEI